MRILFIALIGFLSGALYAQEPASTSLTPAASSSPAVILTQWNVSKVPWDLWFKKNAIVQDKGDHVHFFWNAQDFKGNFELKDKRTRLAEAALQLVARLYPSGAKADKIRVDIVYVLERDSYGEPKWDSMQQVAHLEFSRAKTRKLLKSDKDLTNTQTKKIFSKFEVF